MHFPICTETQNTLSQVIEKAVSKIYMSSSDMFTSFISKFCLAECFFSLTAYKEKFIPLLFLSSREKFQNYLGDLGKHRKQLEEKNDQLVEELQGLSTRHLVYTVITTLSVSISVSLFTNISNVSKGNS